MDEKFLKPYNPQETEDRIYKLWEESGFFNPDICIEKGATKPDAEPFTIVMPPPNVTGILHMGHALMLTTEDSMVRFKRMQGYKTLWLPGTDHAAIATQSKVEKEISKKEGKSRHDIGREVMLERIKNFAKESHDTITSQIKIMGSSCDWSREAFTLDEKRNIAVNTMFKKMYEDELIYRGNRIVNWDPKGQTTISDDEIVYEERKSKLYTFKYSKDFPIPVATTRLETKIGDVAVAVHPDDIRYQKYIGKTFEIPDFCGVKLYIKVISDESVEKDFGTGALGVTPAHSMIDAQMAKKNNLESIQVINEYAKMTRGDERLLGKKTIEAREIIAEWLRAEGLMIEEKEITQNVSTAERTGGIIEPLPKVQWFIDVNKEFTIPFSEIPGIESGSKTTLKSIMRKAVESKSIKIIPEYFDKTYFHWIDNLSDWCISRQIWYGHRIPVWYGKDKSIHLPKLKKIIFVRHGQSESNLAKVWDGQQNSPLTTKGIEEADLVAEKLTKYKISKIYSSDLDRASETAKIIGKKLSLDIEVTKDLREVGAGRLEGQKHNNIPLLVASLSQNEGETAEQLITRAQKIINLLSEIPDEEILIVSHNSFVSVICAILDGKSNNLIDYRQKWMMPNAETVERTLIVEPQEKNLTRDEDTLDTWFSSGLWTFSTLGWPDDTKDLKEFHPTDMLETGYEILFFWVARMVLMSGYALGQAPFKNVYLHGTVRDSKGQKMSKSLGNGIDPLDVAKEFGADAGRMALIYGTAPGTDSKISNEKIKGYKHFANKLWNISRFILGSADELKTQIDYKFCSSTPKDLELLREQQELIKTITKELEEYKMHIVAEKVYQYIWANIADVILEDSKKIFKEGTEEEKTSRIQFLLHTLENSLKLLHPFMPFVTEEIWQTWKRDNSILMVSSWPRV